MPNHITNEMCVTGPREDLIAFVARSTGGYFVTTADPEKARERMLVLAETGQRYMGVFSFGALTGIPEDFGSNWYDWSLENWGTKWDAYDVSFDGIPDGPGAMAGAIREIEETWHLDFTFQTAWSPPIEWLQAATAMFPTLTFRMIYTDEMPNFVGWAVATEGACEAHDYNPGEVAPYPEGDWDEEGFEDKVDEWWTCVRDKMWEATR